MDLRYYIDTACRGAKNSECIAFELAGRRRQDAITELMKMYRLRPFEQLCNGS